MSVLTHYGCAVLHGSQLRVDLNIVFIVFLTACCSHSAHPGLLNLPVGLACYTDWSC